MKGFLDTSVRVPVFYGDHVHHKASLELFDSFDKSTACCAAHTLVEVYSTLPGCRSRGALPVSRRYCLSKISVPG